jgi:hypothetical protein
MRIFNSRLHILIPTRIPRQFPFAATPLSSREAGVGRGQTSPAL